jgi:GST-like protein
MSEMILHGRPGWGSVIIEAQLVLLGMAYRFEDAGDLFKSAAARDALATVNPIAQVPTLVLADGTVMTESAAITLHLADITGRDDCVPPPHAPERARFLRWLIFRVANVYPTFTYADDPARFVALEAAQAGFRTNVDDYAKRLYGMVESEARAPWFLGDRFSALDLYLAAMTRWRPRREWFVANAPRLAAIGDRVHELPALRAVWTRNFPTA